VNRLTIEKIAEAMNIHDKSFIAEMYREDEEQWLRIMEDVKKEKEVNP
jgi:phosphohistidine phosphatase SixA